MGRKSAFQKLGTDSEVTEFMCEFACLLVAAGLTSTRFFDIARLAYFRAASLDAKFRNNRTNQSAVAAMTGLTRVQVRAFAKEMGPSGPSKPDRIQNMIRGWQTDEVFATSNYSPRRLSTGSKNGSFGQLVRRYGGDVPTRSILREMTRTGLVTVRGGFVYLNQRARQTRGEAKLQHLSQVLAQLIRQSGPARDRAYSLRAMIREVTYPSASPKGRAVLQKKSGEGLRAFMSELTAAGYAASIETPPTGTRTTRVTRSRVLILTEELDPNDSERNDDE